MAVTVTGQGAGPAPVRFSLPATISMMAGPYGCYCLTAAEVAQFHVQLVCSARIVSIEVRGRDETAVLRLPITEASAKVRTGDAIDDEEDLDLPVWAGVIPLRLTPGTPVPNADLTVDVPAP